MARALVLDLSRLWLAGLRPTPRGIERVEAAFAGLILAEWPGEVGGLLPTPWGLRLFARTEVEALLRHVAARWREASEPADDPAFRRVREWLAGAADFVAAPIRPRALHTFRRVGAALETIRATGLTWGRDPVEAAARGAIYLNLGHVGFAVPGLDRLFRARADIRTVALIHDVISLDEPQFFAERNRRYFQRVLATVMDRATLTLATSVTAGDTIRALAVANGRGVNIGVVDLAPVFSSVQPPPPDPGLSGRPYFVICGTREPRKNHLMIVQLWRRIVSEHPDPPRLVIAGGRGWGTPLLDATLERSEAIRGHVIRIEDLGSPGLFQLMAQARAVLVPSLAEGFGLPVVEALRLGAPVIASDIPVFAETTAGFATLIDPLDGLGWQAAIAAHGKREEAHAVRQSRARAFAARLSPHRNLIAWLDGL